MTLKTHDDEFLIFSLLHKSQLLRNLYIVWCAVWCNHAIIYKPWCIHKPSCRHISLLQKKPKQIKLMKT